MDEFCKEKAPIARKEHKCDLCHGTIAKGERYVHIVQSTDGDIFDSKYHTVCCDLIRRYAKEMGGYVYPYDDENVTDDIQDRLCCDCERIGECGLTDRKVATCPFVVKKYLKDLEDD